VEMKSLNVMSKICCIAEYTGGGGKWAHQKASKFEDLLFRSQNKDD